MRKFIFQLHLYASLVIFPLLVIFGITGSIMAFEPEIDHIVHAKLEMIKPADKNLSLAEISSIINKAFPKDTIGNYHLSSDPGLSYQIDLQDRTVFINQHTGEILGSTTGPDGWDNFLSFIHQLHLRLALRIQGNPGKTVMTWAGVGLLIILPSGLILWWRQRRLAVRWKAKSRLVWFDIHSLVGVTAFILLITLAGTGIMIGFDNKTLPLLYKLTNSKPVEQPDINIIAPTNGVMIQPDSAYALACAALPEALPFNINVPNTGEPYQIRCHFPEDLTPGGRSMVYLNPFTGKVLFVQSSRTAAAGLRALITNRAIHTGDISGLPSKIIMSLVSLSLVIQVVSGLVMWWKRRKKKVVNL